MSQMINDTLQNVYNRLAGMGKSIAQLQESLDNLNKNMQEKVEKLSQTITNMKENTEKEGKAFELVLEQTGQSFLDEVNELKENIGLKDLTELTQKLKHISAVSQEALKPETVDVLLDEVLKGIKTLMGREKAKKEGEKESKEGEDAGNEPDNSNLPAPPDGAPQPPGNPPS